jgi:arginyl-tRNA synthetase
VLKTLEQQLKTLLNKAILGVLPSARENKFNIELSLPKDKRFGNLSTNIAFQVAPIIKSPPFETAEKIKQELQNLLVSNKKDSWIESITVVKPGFINITYSKKFLNKLIKKIADTPFKFKPHSIGRRKKVQIEFVSANPTGPLSIAHGRQAVVGDVIARILKACGYKTIKEYFINDEGNQIDALGKSAMARCLELQGNKFNLPEDGYQGEYLVDIARNFIEHFGKESFDKEHLNVEKMLSVYTVKQIMDGIKKDLDSIGVHMDVWFSQKKMMRTDAVNDVIKRLRKKGLIYEKDGAIWFKSSSYADDKDRVVVKSTGEYTYLAPDIAYHEDKIKRKFKKVINIWGPDHHGYIPRINAAVRALGANEDFLEVVIIQLATLYKNGKLVSMSTRKGQYITLRQLVHEVGPDVARFFFLMRKTNSHLDFDLALAKKKSMDNPVYYIQYAHARICSILQKQKNDIRRLPRADLNQLDDAQEMALVNALIEYPSAVESAALGREPYFIIVYLRKVAEAFHSFYHSHRVLDDDLAKTAARVKLIKATKNILHAGLNLLGVSSPTSM